MKRIIKFIINKLKYRNCIFDYSNNIGDGSSFEGMNKLHNNVEFTGAMGYGSYIAMNSSIFGKVGRFCSIGPFVRVNYGTHPYSAPFVSTSPSFYSTNPYKSQNGGTFAKLQKYDELRFADKENKYPIVIGSDCWIGEGALIIGGCTISDGSVVLAGAVVTKDVPPYAIVGGVPAKIVGYRYDEETISFLLNTKWWDKEISWIKENWTVFSDIDQFRTLINKNQ